MLRLSEESRSFYLEGTFFTAKGRLRSCYCGEKAGTLYRVSPCKPQYSRIPAASMPPSLQAA